jgi:hypothetical protein
MRSWDPGYHSYFISRKETQYQIGQTNDLEKSGIHVLMLCRTASQKEENNIRLVKQTTLRSPEYMCSCYVEPLVKKKKTIFDWPGHVKVD